MENKDLTYSQAIEKVMLNNGFYAPLKLIYKMQNAGIVLNRKMLADISAHHQHAMEAVLKKVS